MFRAITRMMNEIASITDGRMYGAWLYGSAALDDFQLGWSDIDFVALIDGPISEKQAESLLTLRQDMLKSEPDNLYYRSFEGVIAGLSEYRSQSFQRLVYWGTSGQKIIDQYTPDAFSLFELSKYGKPIYGSNAWILPAPGSDVLVSAVRSHYETIRKFAVKTDESLYSCGWLLDIARCIYSLRHHDVIAKTQAGISFPSEKHYICISDEYLELDILEHEITHAELRARLKSEAQAKIPAWFDEGLALQNDYRETYSEEQWISQTDNGKNTVAPENMDTPAEFYAGEAKDRRFRYLNAKHELNEWLATHGQQGLLELIDQLNKGEDFYTAYGR